MRSSSSAVAITIASVFLPFTCLGSPVHSRRSSVDSEIDIPTGPEPTPACTTLHRFGGFHLGPTSTVFATTATETVTLDCGIGCSSVAVDRFGGHGPIAVFQTTVTETEIATTATEYVCGATATTTPIIARNFGSASSSVATVTPTATTATMGTATLNAGLDLSHLGAKDKDKDEDVLTT